MDGAIATGPSSARRRSSLEPRLASRCGRWRRGDPRHSSRSRAPRSAPKTFTPRRLRADGKDERARRVAAAAAALAPALGVLARAGDGGADVATLDALAAVDAPRLIALVLPSALDAMRRVHASSNGGSQHGHGGVDGGTGADWVDCILGAETSLDVAEVAVVEALERLLEAARDHRILRRQLCTHLFLSFEPWTGGGGVERGRGSRRGRGASASARRLCVG